MGHILDSTQRRVTSARIHDSLSSAQQGMSLLNKGLERFARKRPRALAFVGIAGVIGMLIGLQLLRRR